MTRPKNKRKPLAFGVRAAPGWSDGYGVSGPVHEATIGAADYSPHQMARSQVVEEPDHDD